MTPQHTADYPTLREVLRLPAFAGCTVCGGAAGLDRRVGGVNLTDTPDYARWLGGGAAGYAGELAALYGQPAPDGTGAAPALQHRKLPAPAAMDAPGG